MENKNQKNQNSMNKTRDVAVRGLRFFTNREMPARVVTISCWSSSCFVRVGNDSPFSWHHVLPLRYLYIKKGKDEGVGRTLSFHFIGVHFIFFPANSHIWCLTRLWLMSCFHHDSLIQYMYNTDSNGHHDLLLWLGFTVFIILIEALSIQFELILYVVQDY